MSLHSLEPVPGHFDGEEAYACAVDSIGVDSGTSHQRQTARLANPELLAAGVLILAVQKEAKMGLLVRMPRHEEGGRRRCCSQCESSHPGAPQEIGHISIRTARLHFATHTGHREIRQNSTLGIVRREHHLSVSSRTSSQERRSTRPSALTYAPPQ